MNFILESFYELSAGTFARNFCQVNLAKLPGESAFFKFL